MVPIRSDLPTRHRVRTARWCTLAGLAAVVSAFALTACGPRDGGTAAGTPAAPTTVAAANTVPAPAPAPTVAPAATDARVGEPVPQAPAAVLPATPAAPMAVAQAAPVDPRAAVPSAPAVVNDPAPVRPVPVAAPRATRVAQAPAPSGRLGSIESIEPIRERPQGTGAGAVIGGVAGAVLGNQFGHGLGRAAMTGIGVAGGAIAGNNVERNMRKRVVGYRVHVRLDDGRTRTFERSSAGNLHVGDRVRVDGNGFRRA